MSEAVMDPCPPGVSPPWTHAGHADPQIYFDTMLRERPIAFDPEVGSKGTSVQIVFPASAVAA